jgi:predicted nucleic acid-binding protein
MSSHLVLLDNEAVQALGDPTHPKHSHVVSHVQVVAGRKRRAMPIIVAVPTAIRVEAGWNRNSPAWAFPNRLRIADIPLDALYANAAASIRQAAQVSVADAHIGAVIQSASADRISVITSDPADMRRIAGDRNVTIVTI